MTGQIFHCPIIQVLPDITALVGFAVVLAASLRSSLKSLWSVQKAPVMIMTFYSSDIQWYC